MHQAYFTRHIIVNCCNSHTRSGETHFQHQFSINVWHDTSQYFILEPFILVPKLTGYLDFLVNKLPTILNDVPLATKRKTCSLHDQVP